MGPGAGVSARVAYGQHLVCVIVRGVAYVCGWCVCVYLERGISIGDRHAIKPLASIVQLTPRWSGSCCERLSW